MSSKSVTFKIAELYFNDIRILKVNSTGNYCTVSFVVYRYVVSTIETGFSDFNQFQLINYYNSFYFAWVSQYNFVFC